MMTPMLALTRNLGRRRRAVVAIALTTLIPAALSACGGSDDSGTAQAAAASTTSTTTTLAPTTTRAAASTSTSAATSTTSEATTTTVAASTTTTTVAKQATTPIVPPSDPYAAEPVIELGRLVIPKIGVDMTMYEGIRLTTLDYGPGHWPGSAMPGEPGNVVVGGHRTSKHKVFRNVDDLVAGDEIVFVDPDGTEHVYLVNRVEIVEPDAMWIVDPTDTPTATLFACHPPGSTRQRIVVFADLAA